MISPERSLPIARASILREPSRPRTPVTSNGRWMSSIRSMISRKLVKIRAGNGAKRWRSWRGLNHKALSHHRSKD